MPGSPTGAPKPRRGARITVKISGDSAYQADARLLEAQMPSQRANAQNSILGHLPWTLEKGRQTEVIREETGLYGFREWAGRIATTDCVLSPSPTPPRETIFSGSSTPLPTALAWESALAPPS